MQNIQNIVFDVGNVLIDFCWERACKELQFGDEVIRAFERNMIKSDYWDRMDAGSITEADAIEKFIEAMPEYEMQVRQFWKYPERFVEEYSYAAPMIQEIKQKGYRVYLLSNYPLEMYKLHWPSFSFFSLVDGYVVSAVEKLRKPDQAIYELLLKRYGLQPETCLFFDDRQINVDAAIEAGMQSVLFTGYETVQRLLSLSDRS